MCITTPTPDFRCFAKTAPSTLTFKTEASGGDQTCLHCCFVEPNTEVADVAAYAEVVAYVAETTFAEFGAAFAESAELGEFEEFATLNDLIYFPHHLTSSNPLSSLIDRMPFFSHFA